MPSRSPRGQNHERSTLSSVLALLANALTAANWFLFLGGGLALTLIIVRTRTEEEKLLERFDESYRVYMMRAGPFFPGLGANRRGA